MRSVKLFLIFLLLNSFSGFAQQWELGLTAGGMGYMGDLNPHKFYKINNFAIGGVLKKNIDGYWAIKASFLYGKVSANDADSPYPEQVNRNLSFFSPVKEGSLQVEFNFFDFGLNYGQKRFTPYIFSGISFFGFNPKANYQGNTYELKHIATEENVATGDPAYKTTAIAIPVGAGVKYRIKGNLNLAAEFGFRTANTDYLDDVSQRYPVIDPNSQNAAIRMILSDRSDNKIGSPDIQRGDFRKKDS
ncbi:MAG: hypothetical protein EOO47_28775, partial [Flavobacterium sp.]